MLAWLRFGVPWLAWRSNSPGCQDNPMGYHCDITFPRRNGKGTTSGRYDAVVPA
jgi:hypothetical protein